MFRAFLPGLLAVSLSNVILSAERAPVPAPEKPQPKVFAPDPVPAVNEQGQPVRTVNDQGYRIELNLTSQRIGVYAPEPEIRREDVNAIEPGDTVTVATEGVTLRQGQQALANLRKGQRLVVTSIKDQWVATAVADAGQAKSGWVLKSQVKLAGHEDQILPTLNHAIGSNFVPAAVLAQKSKQFDDGLYAAVELAAQNGAGEFAGKRKLLLTLLEALKSEPSLKATAVLAAALKLGGHSVSGPAPWQADVQKETAAFLADPKRSKPLGFYTWTPELSAIFKQDRMLQTPLKVFRDGAAQLGAELALDGEARETYEKYLRLTARLTNPWKLHDFRALYGQGSESISPDTELRIFPPSTSHENELVMDLYGDKPIPEGFDLMNELIARIRSGQIDLTPKPESGWYDHQTFALEPLVTPEKTPEAARLSFDDEYKKLLTNLFKGALALTRETHVKQMEIPPPAEAAPGDEEPKKQVYIRLDLSAEPLVTHYQRKAESYRFVRNVLEVTFGIDTLKTLRRQTAEGEVAVPLAEELAQMVSLYEGAALTTARQIGLPQPADQKAEATATTFLKWGAELSLDPDLSKDSRMMVPVFYDQMRKRTKVWVFLGWTRRPVSFGLNQPPAYRIFDKDGNPVEPGKGVEVHFHGRYESLVYPEMAEVYVSQLLNRDEFRRHCDVYRTRSAILNNLK